MKFLLCKFLLKCLSINPLVLSKYSHKWKICPTFQLVLESFCLKKQFDILNSINYNSQQLLDWKLQFDILNSMNYNSQQLLDWKLQMLWARKKSQNNNVCQVVATLGTSSHGINHRAIEYMELWYTELMAYRATPRVMKEAMFRNFKF